MYIRERELQTKLLTQSNIQSINLDLNILSNISKNDQFLNLSQTKPKNLSLNQLSYILANKNKNMSIGQRKKDKAREWLQKNGLDIVRLANKIKQNAKQAEEMSQIIRLKQESQQKVPIKKQGMSVSHIGASRAICQKDQTQLIKSLKRQCISSNILRSISSSNKLNSHNILFSNLHHLIENNNTKLYTSIQSVHQQDHSQQQQQEEKIQIKQFTYQEFIKDFVVNGDQADFHRLKEIRSFWNILHEHLNAINIVLNQQHNNNNNSLQDNIKTLIAVKSINLIQNKNARTIHGYQVNYSVLDDIIGHLKSQFQNLSLWKDANGKPIWAYAYILFKAGKFPQFIKLVSSVDKQMAQDFIKYQQNYKRLNPEVSLSRYNLKTYKDSFYAQLCHIINGNDCFQVSTGASNDLDPVWLLLRILGLYRKFPSIETKYQFIINTQFSFKGRQIEEFSEEMIKKIFYLAGYKKFIQYAGFLYQKKGFQEDSYFRNKDYFHLFTVIKIFPQIFGTLTQRQQKELNERYDKVLNDYLQDLKTNKKMQQLSVYVLLSSNLKRTIQSLIKTNKEYESFDWKTLKDLMRKRDAQNYEQMIQHIQTNIILEMKLQSIEDYIYMAEKYQYVFKQENQCHLKKLQYHVIANLKGLYLNQLLYFQSVFKQNASKGYQNTLNAYLQIPDEQLSNEQYKRLKYNSIKEQLNDFQKKMNGQLLKIQEKSQFSLCNINQPHQFLNELIQLNRLLSYEQIGEIRYNQMKVFESIWQKCCQVNTHQQAFRCQNGKKIINIIRFLNHEIKPSIPELFVFYLNKLVRLNQVKTNLQNAENGALQFKEKMIKNLEKLEQFYKGQQYNHQYSVKQLTNPFIHCKEYKVFKDSLIKQLQNAQIEFPQRMHYYSNDETLYQWA